MLLPSTAAAAGAAAVSAVLAGASLANVWQTRSLVAHNSAQRGRSNNANDGGGGAGAAVSRMWNSVDEALEDVRSMKRRELVSLFLECDAPFVGTGGDIDVGGVPAVAGMYDGHILDNGPVLTPVSNFITNVLFGSGQKWKGKVYSPGGMGKNRFEGSASATFAERSDEKQEEGECSNGEEALDRTFDYFVGPSSFRTGDDGEEDSLSLVNDYAPHASFVRASSQEGRRFVSPLAPLWKGMADELRVVPVGGAGDGRMLLIGMGYFSWSGGVWNCNPFCLVSSPASVTDGRNV